MEKDTVLEKGMLMGRVFCKYSETLQLVLGLDTKYPTFFTKDLIHNKSSNDSQDIVNIHGDIIHLI